MQITGPWLTAAGTQRVLRLLTGAGHQAYVVGGCLRNALLHQPVGDVDIATSARPETVMDLAEKAGLKAIPTGIEHGTITLIAAGTGYEVTTFRADVETDGRRAVVQFSTQVQQDAERRDFTMNALYASAEGQIVDPLGGLADLKSRRVRFINDPDQRIKEDYLRILRFFRFSAWYGDPDAGFDSVALNAVARNVSGLSHLSLERITAEMLKLLAAPDPAPAVGVMSQIGVLQQVLPGASSRALAPLIHFEQAQTRPPQALRRLAALLPQVTPQLRLSKAQTRHLTTFQTAIAATDQPGALGYHHGLDTALDILLLRAALLETPINPSQITQAKTGAVAQFPISARDLMPTYTGPALGERLARLEEKWIASNFQLTRDSLLSHP